MYCQWANDLVWWSLWKLSFSELYILLYQCHPKFRLKAEVVTSVWAHISVLAQQWELLGMGIGGGAGDVWPPSALWIRVVQKEPRFCAVDHFRAHSNHIWVQFLILQHMAKQINITAECTVYSVASRGFKCPVYRVCETMLWHNWT